MAWELGPQREDSIEEEFSIYQIFASSSGGYCRKEGKQPWVLIPRQRLIIRGEFRATTTLGTGVLAL